MNQSLAQLGDFGCFVGLAAGPKRWLSVTAPPPVSEDMLSSIDVDRGPFGEHTLRARLASSRSLLADLEPKLEVHVEDGKRTASQSGRRPEMIDGSVEHSKPIDSRPIHDRMNAVLAVERTAEGFHHVWRPRPGPAVKQALDKEHWTPISALSRRFAMGPSTMARHIR